MFRLETAQKTPRNIIVHSKTRPARYACGLILLSAAMWSCSSGPTGPSPAEPDAPGFVSCSVFGDSSTSAYTLPFAPGRRFRVTKTFGHYTPLNDGVGLYAVDIDMPMRTPVLAIRSGVVVAVEQRFSDDDHAVYHENWVMVRHADGSVARYIHLAQNGARVSVGDTVVQGQTVGLSGNSGDSSGPHLHFDGQTCGPNLPPAYNRQPCGMTVPLTFRNTVPQACGLGVGLSYTALDFQPDSK